MQDNDNEIEQSLQRQPSMAQRIEARAAQFESNNYSDIKEDNSIQEEAQGEDESAV